MSFVADYYAKVSDEAKDGLYFHYTSVDAAIKIILSKRVRFSSPATFNDPFEFMFAYSGEQQKRDEATRFLKNSTGVFCCSRDQDNLLMWGHYAKKHKGVVLGFRVDIMKYLSSSYSSDGIDVKYPDDKAFFRPSAEETAVLEGKEKNEEAYNDAIYKILATKSKEWSYEQETRFFIGLEKNDKGAYPLYKDALFPKYGFVLDSVTFGLNTSIEDQGLIINALSSEEMFANTKFYQMKMEGNHYQLVAEGSTP